MRQLLRALVITASATSIAACAFDNPDTLFATETADEKTSTTVQENTAEGYVAGANLVTDDFGDEGIVDRNHRSHSMAAGLWQMILWADGAIESDGTTFDLGDVDCDFGPNTEAATVSWQRAHGIRDVDGSAGPGTLSKADDNLQILPFEGTSSSVFYVGSHDIFEMIRLGDPATPRHAYQAIGTDGARRVIRYSASACSSSMWFGFL